MRVRGRKIKGLKRQKEIETEYRVDIVLVAITERKKP